MNIQLYLKRSSPTILSCLAGIGVVGVSYLSANASPKAIRLLKEAREFKGEDLTRWEKIKLAAPIYIPTAVVGLGTIACIMGANTLSRKQQATLTSAYALLDAAYKEYRDKVAEVLGEAKENDIFEEIIKDHCRDVDAEEDGTLLFWDEYSRRHFNCTMAEMIEAEYLLNRMFVLRGYVTLNDFYDLIGLDPTPTGAVLGWSMGAGCEVYGYEWIDFTHKLVKTDDGLECYIIGFPFGPTRDYMDF